MHLHKQTSGVYYTRRFSILQVRPKAISRNAVSYVLAPGGEGKYLLAGGLTGGGHVTQVTGVR
jgi:hypothetical protein